MALAGLICGYASLILVTVTVTTIVYNVKESNTIEAAETADDYLVGFGMAGAEMVGRPGDFVDSANPGS